MIGSGSAPTGGFIHGSRHAFQPGAAQLARRKPGASADFSAPGQQPLADRAELFARG